MPSPTPAPPIPAVDAARLTLRGHTLGDADESATVWADPEVTRHIGGRYAFYEHLRPGPRVKPGDRVRKGAAAFGRGDPWTPARRPAREAASLPVPNAVMRFPGADPDAQSGDAR